MLSYCPYPVKGLFTAAGGPPAEPDGGALGGRLPAILEANWEKSVDIQSEMRGKTDTHSGRSLQGGGV